MKELELPVMSMSTNLNTALTGLKKSRRAALVSEHEGAYHLFSAEKIAVARHRKLNTLSDLIADDELKPVIVRFQPVRERMQIGPARKKAIGGVRRLERSRAATAAFSLKDIAGKSAVVAVRNISIAARFAAAPRQYCCDGPRQHSDFPPPYVSVGDPCPHQDGYKIVII